MPVGHCTFWYNNIIGAMSTKIVCLSEELIKSSKIKCFLSTYIICHKCSCSMKYYPAKKIIRTSLAIWPIDTGYQYFFLKFIVALQSTKQIDWHNLGGGGHL